MRGLRWSALVEASGGEAVWSRSMWRSESCLSDGSKATRDRLLDRSHRLFQRFQRRYKGIDTCRGDELRTSAHATSSQVVGQKTRWRDFRNGLRGDQDGLLLPQRLAGVSHGAGNVLSGVSTATESFPRGVRWIRETVDYVDIVFRGLVDVTPNIGILVHAVITMAKPPQKGAHHRWRIFHFIEVSMSAS